MKRSAMSRIEITYEPTMAAGRDAANRHMQKNKRAAWNLDDRNVAARTFHKLYQEEVKNENVSQDMAA